MIADNSQRTTNKTPHFDVIVVGAGLSGIGMGCHLKRNCRSKSFTILEARETLGGTWDLFRYPGVRADSDMYTLSYNFKPWRGKKEIADGGEILEYIKEAAAEHQVTKHIRYGHSVQKATWCSRTAKWTLEATANGTTQKLTCNMLLMCAGYYSYQSGHTPAFQGQDDFRGQIIHPQQWPTDLDYKDKRIIVVGSGATSVSLVPVIAEDASHVVMLQRSPTYMMTRPETTKWARYYRRIIPVGISHRIGRWWNLRLSQIFYQLSREKPDKIRKFLLEGVRNELEDDYDVEKHFSPSYAPWDQRVCLVRNNDLFDAINSGSVSVVTGHIEEFTQHGIRLFSGDELNADIIVTATGLELKVLGGTELVVDGSAVNPAETFTYKGMMNSDVPNLINTFGYVNASWTLRSDLIGEFACRLINFMDNKGVHRCTPRLREVDRGMSVRPFIDNFSSNYIQRGTRLMPKQGDHEPWIYTQDYKRDQARMLSEPLDDGTLIFH